MLDILYRYLLRFVDLTPKEFTRIEELIEIRQFARKTRLVAIGEKENYLDFIITGLTRKFFYRHKEEVVIQIAKENEMIYSSVSFFSSTPSDFVVEAIENTTLASISRSNIEKMYDISPKMDRLGRLVIIDWLLQKETMECSRLKQGPKERFLDFIGDNPDLLLRVPQKFLASYLSIKPETFSRYKHLLVKQPVNGLFKSLDTVNHQ